MSHTTWFDTDDSACSNVNVFVNKLTVIAPNANATPRRATFLDKGLDLAHAARAVRVA